MKSCIRTSLAGAVTPDRKWEDGRTRKYKSRKGLLDPIDDTKRESAHWDQRRPVRNVKSVNA